MAATMEKTRTPGVYKRGSRYVVTFRHRGRQHRESFRTYAEAREAKARRNGGERRPSSSERVGDYFDRWIVTYRGRTSRGLEDTTRELYRRTFEQHVLPFLGRMRLRDVAPGDVRDWMGWLERRGGSPNTVRQGRAVLSAMFATAREDGLVQSNPAAGVRHVARVERPKRKRKPLTGADVAAILGAMPPGWQVFFELLTHTGVRISEMLGLTWGHVDLGDEPCVRVREQVYQGRRKKLKTDASTGTIPLSAGMARKLAAIRPEDVRPEAPVFATRTETPYSYANVYNQVLRPALRRCGLAVKQQDGSWDYQGIAFHAFRKACGSLLLAQGGKDLKQVQGWLRHSRLTTTLDSYIHEVDGGLGSADVLDELVLIDGDNGVTTERPQPAAGIASDRGEDPASEAGTDVQPQVATGPGADS